MGEQMRQLEESRSKFVSEASSRETALQLREETVAAKAREYEQNRQRGMSQDEQVRCNAECAAPEFCVLQQHFY